MYKLRILHPNAMTRLRLQPVMHGMAGILFFFNAIGTYNMPSPNWWMTGLFFLMGLISIGFPFIMRRLRNLGEANSLVRMLQTFALLSGSLFFLSHLQPVVGGTLFFAGLGLAYAGYAEYRILQPAYVRMDNTYLILPTIFSSRRITWNEMKNVILRNDLLTLDFKNNKILQLEVLDDVPASDAAAMNEFFQQRIQ